MGLKRYRVDFKHPTGFMPSVTDNGRLQVVVSAESKEDACEAAWDRLGDDQDWTDMEWDNIQQAVPTARVITPKWPHLGDIDED